MFNHDIEVNFNLNRMGVAWFQQHNSPKSSTQSSRVPTSHQNRNLNHTSPKERSLRHRNPFPSEALNEPVCNPVNPRRQTNKNHGFSLGNDILKTPTKVNQSKRFCQRPKSSNRKVREEPLELVDVIDIEDEDNSTSAFFVGINNNGLLSRPKSNHIQTGKMENHNESFLFDNIGSSNRLFQPTSNRSSFNSKTILNNTMLGKNELNGSTTNRNATPANIINAVNTISISNGERLQTSVNLQILYYYIYIIKSGYHLS